MKPGPAVFDMIAKGVARVVALAEIARDLPADDPRWSRLRTEIFNLDGLQGAVGDWADNVIIWTQTGREGLDDGPALRLVPPVPDGAA